MTTRTSTELKQAFKQFVELVKPIEDVCNVVVLEDGKPKLFTFIRQLDDAVSSQVHNAEFQIMDDFPELPVEFHVRYLEGRPLKSFISPLSALTFSRKTPDQAQV